MPSRFPDGTTLGSPIVPGSITNTFPTHYAIFGAGGVAEVASIAIRNSIPVKPGELHFDGYGSGRRRLGMRRLITSGDPVDWVEYRLEVPGYLILNDAARLVALADNNNWVRVAAGGAGLTPEQAQQLADALPAPLMNYENEEHRAIGGRLLVADGGHLGVDGRAMLLGNWTVDHPAGAAAYADFVNSEDTAIVRKDYLAAYIAERTSAAAIIARVDRAGSNVSVEISPSDSNKLIFNIKRSGILIPAINEFRFNRTADTLNAPGYVRKDSLAVWPMYTNATSLTIRGKTNLPAMYVPYAAFNILVDGVHFATIGGFIAADAEQVFNVSGLPAGNKLVEICEGGQVRIDDSSAGPICVIQFTSITLPLGFNASVPDVTPAAEGVVVLGNSRSVGGVMPVAVLTSFAGILRARRSSDIFLTGYAQLRMAEHVLGAAKQDALVAEFVQHLDGYNIKKIILGPDLYNDWGAGIYSPAELLAGYLELITKLRAAIPDAKIFVGCTFSSRYAWGGANARGATQQDYYNMEKGVSANFASNVFTLDLMAAGLTAADYEYDDTHLTASGDAKIADYIDTIFNAS